MIEKNQSYILFAGAEHSDRITNLYKGMDKVIVSFSADGKVALEKRNVRCLFPDDLIELPDLNKLGSDNLQLVRDICEVIDNKLQERFPFLQENEIDLFRNGFFNIKVFFDSLCSSFLILERLFQKIGNRDVVLFSSGDELGKIAEGKCPLVPSLIEHVFLKDYPAIKIIPGNNYRSNRIRLDDHESYSALMRLCMKTWFRRDSGTAYGSKGIVLDNRYDVKTLIGETLGGIDFFKIFMFKRIIAIKSLHTRRLSIKMLFGNSEIYETIGKVFQEIADELAANKIFHGDSTLGRFAVLCLEQYMIKSLGGILQHGEDIKKMLSEMAPTLLCTSSCRTDMNDAFILGIVKSLNIPVVTYQEGGGAGYLDWPLFNIDSELSDYFLVYGKGVAESPYIKKGMAKIVPVGSIYLDQVNIKTSSTGKDVSPSGIYVILDNIKTSTWQHYPYNGGYFSQAYRHQSKIIESLKKVGHEGLILKTVEGRDDLYSSLIDIKDHIQIETKPLSSVLHNASAFVLEYPSTVLQECLLTDKPIALFFNKTGVRFDDHALDLLKRRVRVASEYDEIPGIMEALIEDVRLGNPMTKNKDFLMNYCLMEKSMENVDNFFRSFSYKDVPARRI